MAGYWKGGLGRGRANVVIDKIETDPIVGGGAHETIACNRVFAVITIGAQHDGWAGDDCVAATDPDATNRRRICVHLLIRDASYGSPVLLGGSPLLYAAVDSGGIQSRAALRQRQ